MTTLPEIIGALSGGELVAPCRVVLRTAQAFRLIGRPQNIERAAGRNYCQQLSARYRVSCMSG